MDSRIITSGKRKTAVARAVAKLGSGKVTINNKPREKFSFLDKLKIDEPLKICESVLGKTDFDVAINVKGGGDKGQIDASRVALARAIVAITKSKEVEKAFLDYDRNLLVPDVRRKEANKPGDSKARRGRQSSFR